MSTQLERFETFTTFARRLAPLIPTSTLRFWRFTDYKNVNSCFIRVGRRLLVDPGKFEAWLLEHGTNPEHKAS